MTDCFFDQVICNCNRLLLSNSPNVMMYQLKKSHISSYYYFCLFVFAYLCNFGMYACLCAYNGMYLVNFLTIWKTALIWVRESWLWINKQFNSIPPITGSVVIAEIRFNMTNDQWPLHTKNNLAKKLFINITHYS